MAREVVVLLALVAAAAAVRLSHHHRPNEKVVIPGLLELDEELADAMKLDPLALNLTDDKSVINDPESHPVRATVYTYEDKERLRKHPDKKTMKIVRMLDSVKQHLKADSTVENIKKSWRLLEMYRVIKKEMVSMLKSTGQAVPDLPSEEKTSRDATGRQWADAKLEEDPLQKALKERDDDINYERSVMHYQALAESPKLREAAQKAKVAKNAKMMAKLAKKNVHQVHGRPPFCVPPGCVVLDCVPPACAPHAVPVVAAPAVAVAPIAPVYPIAKAGVPQGVQPWVKSSLPGEPLPSRPIAASSPCACIASPTPCPCRSEALIVKKVIPPPETVEVGKPSTVNMNEVMQSLQSELGRARFASVRSDARHPATQSTNDKAQAKESSDCRPPLCFTG